MRNNGSAIISVLDVGIVYTKFGSVTDDIFIKGGKYGKAVDIGEYRYGKHSLLKLHQKNIEDHGDAAAALMKLLKDPDDSYKRRTESRDPKEILDSIIAAACRLFLRNLPGHPSPRQGQQQATSMPPAALAVLVPLDFDPPSGLKIYAPL